MCSSSVNSVVYNLMKHPLVNKPILFYSEHTVPLSKYVTLKNSLYELITVSFSQLHRQGEL